MFEFLLSVAFAFISLSVNAADVVAEVAWVVYSDDQHHIYFSRYDGKVWSDIDAPIYSSDRALTGPALGTGSSGNKILIWTEQLPLKTVLMSMTSIHKSSPARTVLDWSEPVLFSGGGVENFAPSIAFDGNDHGWVFWSSAKMGGVSNIFLAKYIDQSWHDPLKVNKSNDVPDFSPMVSINQSGDVTVKWNTYDAKLGTYALDSRTYIVENPTEIDINNEQSLESIRLPVFLPSNQRVFIHFPTNRMAQSIPIN